MKRFYNNTLIGGAFSKALRVVALLCVLLGFSSSAWGDTYYIDASCISGVQQISWLQYQNNSGNIVSQNTNFNGKTAFQFTADAGKTLKLQLQIVSGNTTIYPQLHNINLTGNNNCIELQLDNNNQLSYTQKVYSSLKCAGACTPSATITGASLSADKKTITLSGSLTTVCSATDTYYGWQYCTDGKSWSESNYVAGAPNNAHHSTTPVNDYSNTWAGPSGGLVPGTTYYFRAYAYVDGTFYSDNNTRSVTIPSSGSDGGADCSGVVYLDPNIYVGADAWFAAYFFGNEDIWVEMTPACDGLYKAMIPDGATGVTFVRKNPADKTLESWNNKWNQTVDLQIQTNKYFKVENWNAKDGKETGTWYDTDCTDGCTPAEQPSTNVLLSREAIVNKSAKTATMYGYLKKTDCFPITKRGFYYCSVNDGAVPCTPTEASDHVDIQDVALERGEEFNATLPDVVDGKTYYYRAYAEIDGKIQLSQETRSFATDPCIPQECCGSKAIVYSINAAFTQDNECKLQFKNLQAAINHLKETAKRDDDYAYVTNNSGSYNLNQPVEMRVAYYDNTPDDPKTAYMYEGTADFGITAGNEDPDHINLIENFNKNSTTPENTLSIKPLGNKAKPWIHHIVIRNSKNIVLDSLCIYSDISGKGDNALEIDVNSLDWGHLDIDPTISSVAPMLDANITIQNSMIGSAGFTGVHVSCYGGITFKNNDFECTYPGTESNDIKWGASAKFLACKDVKFIQNNFRGSQSTLLWVQECQNMLFMNNVFWNTNTNANNTYQPIAAVRLVHQFNSTTNDYKDKSDIKNISCFYNTFYLAEDKKDSDHKYNFFVLSNTTDSHSSSAAFDLNSIKFQYNNCYSYDAQVSGRSDDPFLGKLTSINESANFCPNNFWSQYDAEKGNESSEFAFGCSSNEFNNVKGLVCATTATGPASLIVNGKAMNKGVKPDITSTGIELEPNELTADRYLAGVRPGDSGWTYGAYQSKDEIKTNTIYWVGTTDKWDDRNNWEYITEVDGKEVRQRVSCVNKLSEDLKVIIEEIGTVEVQGGRKWPRIPSSFDADTRTEETKQNKDDLGIPAAEQVSAGNKFASTIELEYGAGLRGVENLKDSEGNVLYDNAIVHFDADRSKWLLVGHIVKPLDEETRTYRTGLSGDYYLQHVPQVYMHQAKLEKDDVVWDKTFADLNIPVPSNEIYAINVTEYYGTSWFSVGLYNYMYKTNYSDTEPHPYTFTGRFVVSEDNKPGEEYVYTGLSSEGKNLLNNVYPCNLDALEIESSGLGTVNIYDYKNGSFVSTSAKKYAEDNKVDNVFIKAQNGFVFTPAKGISSLSLTDDILAEGSTRTRSTQVQLPTFSLQVDNANTTAPGASNVVVVLDEAQPANYSSPLNTPKVFTRNEDTPEAYIVSGNENCSRLYVDGDTKRIPLGIRLQKAMNITFEKVYSIDFSKVILLDAKTGKEYNLLERNYTTEKLLVSENNKDIVNRFFLVLEQEEYLPDDDVVTDVEDVVEGADINVYAVNGNAIRVVSTGVDLQSIYVSDMAGRTMKYEANGNFVELQLPVAQGVYMVHVIGDNATKTEKVIVK